MVPGSPDQRDPQAVGAAPSEEELRRVAVRRLKKKREFRNHLFVYVVVNVGLWAVWVIDGINSTWQFPWPIFPTVFWGLFVIGHAIDVYWRDPLSEEAMQREIEQLRAASTTHRLDTYDTDDDEG
jgi:hypothetical protein